MTQREDVVRDANIQGSNTTGQAFAALAALAYAAESSISQSYIHQSQALASCLDGHLQPNGLRGKTVLDVGCGFGTTTVHLSRLGPPSRIAGVDNEQAMVDLYRLVLESGEPLDQALARLGAPAVLERFYPPLLAYLQRMRLDFQTGIFRRTGGSVSAHHLSCLSLDPGVLGDSFDAVTANNVVHWPFKDRVRELKKEGVPSEEASDRAFDELFRALASPLRKGGLLAFLEPRAFVEDDVDPKSNADLKTQEMNHHPAVIRVNQELNVLLKEKHRIERLVPGTSEIFKLSRMRAQLTRNGLQLIAVRCYEYPMSGDAVDSMVVRVPMMTGDIKLPLEIKIALAIEAGKRARTHLTPQELQQPLRNPVYIFIAEKL